MSPIIKKRKKQEFEEKLYKMDWRWIFCMDTDINDEDCACCLNWTDKRVTKGCSCICHKRIEKLKKLGRM